MKRTARVVVDLSAIVHNYRFAKSQVGSGIFYDAQGKAHKKNSKLMAVVKANAYGHGLCEVVRALSEADGFAVSCVSEGVVVRSINPLAKILVLQGAQTQQEMMTCAEHTLDCVLHQDEHIQWLEQTLPKPMNVWVKVDTGMHRLGFSPEVIDALNDRLLALKSSSVGEINYLTHMACADDVSSSMTLAQTAVFNQVSKVPEQQSSLANSAALLAYAETDAHWQRIGIALYGVNPFSSTMDAKNPIFDAQKGLKPAMSFYSKVIAINTYDQGQSIGYGATWVCPKETKVAVVAVGYADGYPRGLSTSNVGEGALHSGDQLKPEQVGSGNLEPSQTALGADSQCDPQAPQWPYVLIAGERCPILGRVSMDMISVDVSQCPHITLGQTVELWGAHVPVKTLAECAGTLSYELLCGVTGRVSVEYVGDCE